MYYLLRKNGSNVSELWSADTASGRASPSLAGVAMVDFDISKDGRDVAYTARNGKTDEIFVAPLDASAAPRMVAKGGDSVSFGPPGELTFREVGAKANYLDRVRLNGGAPERVLAQTIIDKYAVSPSGAWVAAEGLGASQRGTCAVPLRGGALKTICSGVYCMPGWSPDGRFLYITLGRSKVKNARNSSGTTRVFANAPGQELPALPEGGLDGSSGDKMPKAATIGEGPVEPGPGLETYAFEKSEFSGNLFRIPLH